MKKHWTFTRLDKIGIISLGGLIVGLTIVLNVNSAVYTPAVYEIDTTDIEYVSLVEEIENIQSEVPDKKKNKKSYSLFNFDPNTIGSGQWEELGFSTKQANSILKYRDNYGPFKVKEDLKKVFVISDEKFKELEPFITIGEIEEKLVSLSININKATNEELQKINGIGEVYAKRIIKYRDLLGGFHMANQFSEVYGLSDDAIQALTNNVYFDGDLNKIEINTADKNTLKKHPYVNFEIAASILKQRELNKLINLDFLVEQGLIEKTQRDKILPYFLF